MVQRNKLTFFSPPPTPRTSLRTFIFFSLSQKKTSDLLYNVIFKKWNRAAERPTRITTDCLLELWWRHIFLWYYCRDFFFVAKRHETQGGSFLEHAGEEGKNDDLKRIWPKSNIYNKWSKDKKQKPFKNRDEKIKRHCGKLHHVNVFFLVSIPFRVLRIRPRCTWPDKSSRNTDPFLLPLCDKGVRVQQRRNTELHSAQPAGASTRYRGRPSELLDKMRPRFTASLCPPPHLGCSARQH